jgi:hypothetical protein
MHDKSGLAVIVYGGSKSSFSAQLRLPLGANSAVCFHSNTARKCLCTAKIMRLLKKSSQSAREYRTAVRVCPSGKSVDPKFLSSNDVLAHSRIVEEYASIRELIASVNTSAFVGT